MNQQQLQQLQQYCQRWHIAQMELFGSVLNEFRAPNERIKVLLKFEEGYAPTLRDRMNMEMELEKLFGINRQVDLFSYAGIKSNIIPLHRENILSEDTALIYPVAPFDAVEPAEASPSEE